MAVSPLLVHLSVLLIHYQEYPTNSSLMISAGELAEFLVTFLPREITL